MTQRSERRSAWRALGACGCFSLVLVAIACGKAASPSSSSSSHWLVCETDLDCAGAGSAASCGGDGYCVDAAGVRVRLTEGSPDAGTAAPDEADDCVGASCSQCPAPNEDSGFICTDRTTVWARDPGSGTCCRYEGSCLAPSWPRFESEGECQTSCRCAEIDYGDPPNAFGIERILLACACGDANCVMNVDDEVARICQTSFGVPWVRTEGCGMIDITLQGGFSVSSSIYDAATGALVGTSSFGDISGPPCHTYGTVAGRTFECETVTRCELCGTRFDPSIPPCE